ncbi:MAG: hypothetical protein DRP20_05510 [Thermotogae bacterium]|nr:MAG: hypothetical protein DRP20_05510 [Thermotogota bacterium]
MNRIGKRWLIILFMIALGALSTYEMRQLKIGSYFKAQVGTDSPYVETEKQMMEEFAIRDLLLVAIPIQDNDHTLQEVITNIRQTKGVSLVINPLQFPLTLGKPSIAHRLGLIGEYNGDRYAIALIVISASNPESVSKSIFQATSGYNVKFFGSSFIGAMALDYISMILRNLSALAIAVIFCVFFYRLRSLAAAALSFAPTLLATFYLLGIYAAFGKQITLENVLMPFITLVMGSAASLHYMSHYLSLNVSNPVERAEKAFKEVSIPILMTTSTTVIGFLSLCITRSPAMTELGLSGAYGITAAGLTTFAFLPPLSTFVKAHIPVSQSDRVDLFFVENRKRNLWIFLIFATVISLFSFSVKREFHVLMFFKQNSEVMAGAQIVRKIAGVTVPAMIRVQFDIDPISSEAMSILQEIQQEVQPFSMRTISILDLNELFPDFLKNLAFLSIPEGLFINRHSNSAMMMVFPKDSHSQTHRDLEKRLQTIKLPHLEKISITGENYKYLEMNDRVLKSQSVSIFVAVAVITLMMIAMLKSFKLGLLSVIPIVVTLINIYGFLGLFKIPLNVISAYILNIVLGAGIDYAIHFMYSYRKKLPSPDTLIRTVELTGKSILANAVGIGLGFSVLLFSPMKVHVHIAVLMFIAMITASFYTLFFLCGIARSNS